MKQLMDIIYHTTRQVHSVEDKLKIATPFIFCDKLGSEKFAELLYCNDVERFINEKLQDEFASYEVDLTVNFSNPNVRNAFYLTLEEVRKKMDENGYYKALFERDPFALVIAEICNTNFDNLEVKRIKKEIKTQLKLF